MQFRISIFSNEPAVTAPIGSGVLENSGNDFEEAAQGTLIVQGVTLEASLKLTLDNPAQTKLDLDDELYDEKL